MYPIGQNKVQWELSITSCYSRINGYGLMDTGCRSSYLRDAMMSNPGEVLGLLQSGDLRALAYSGKKTPAVLGNIPTLGEAGYELGISMPRGLVLPPDVPKQAQQWWIDTMKKVVQTPEWKAYIDKQLLTENVLYGEDFRSFLQKTQGTFADILRKSGAIK